jgi:hypothetical protein
MSNEVEVVRKESPNKENPHIVPCYELTPKLPKVSHLKKEKNLLDLFYKASNTLIPKSDKITTKKRKA